MDERAQMQAVIDKLTGVPPETLPLPSALDEPWRSIYLKVRRCGDFQEAEMLLAKVTRGIEERERYGLVAALCDMLPSDEGFSAYPSLHEISGRFADVEWLWPSWIPRGMVTLFGAAPGAGKSLVALDLARRVIHGEPFPDGAPSLNGGANPCPGKRVLMIGAGYIGGRLSVPEPLDVQELQAALESSLISSFEPALRQEIFAEIDNRLQLALAADRDKLQQELARQVHRDMDTYVEQTLTVVGNLMDQRFMNFARMLEAARIKERQHVAAAFDYMETRFGDGLLTLAAHRENLWDAERVSPAQDVSEN